MNRDPLAAADFTVQVGPDVCDRAYFGRDVLRGLLSGIDESIAEFNSKPRSYRTIGPAMIACAPWFSYRPLFDAIQQLKGACVVIGKQPDDRLITRDMRAYNALDRGLFVKAFPELSMMWPPSEDGGPRVLGPHDRFESDVRLQTFRTVGYGKTESGYPPLMHAKLALLGTLWWGEDDEFGTGDVLGFRDSKVWISSANFTVNSRGHLEFGYWSQDETLIRAVRRFLMALVATSEDFDSSESAPTPELLEADIDTEAIGDAVAEMGPLPDPDEED